MPILWREEHKNVYWKFSNKNKRIIQKKPTKQHKLKTFLYVYISLLGPFASLYIYIHVLASAKEIQFENLLPSFFFCWSKRKFYTRLHFLLIIIIWLLGNKRKNVRTKTLNNEYTKKDNIYKNKNLKQSSCKRFLWTWTAKRNTEKRKIDSKKLHTFRPLLILLNYSIPKAAGLLSEHL